MELDLPALLGVAQVQPEPGAAELERRDHLLRAFLLLLRRSKSARQGRVTAPWAHGGCGHPLRCSLSTMLRHRLLRAPRICRRKARARGRAVLPRRFQTFLPNPEHPQGWTFHQRALDESRLWEARVSTDLGAVVFQQVFVDLIVPIIEHDPERPDPLTVT